MKLSNKIAFVCNPMDFSRKALLENIVNNAKLHSEIISIYNDWNTGTYDRLNELPIVTAKIIPLLSKERLYSLSYAELNMLCLRLSDITANCNAEDANSLKVVLFLDCQIIDTIFRNASGLTKDNLRMLLLTVRNIDMVIRRVSGYKQLSSEDKQFSVVNDYVRYLYDRIGRAMSSVSSDVSALAVKHKTMCDIDNLQASDSLEENVSYVSSNVGTGTGADASNIAAYNKMKEFYHKLKDIEITTDVTQAENDFIIANMHKLPEYTVSVYGGLSKDEDYLESPMDIFMHIVNYSLPYKHLLEELENIRIDIINLLDGKISYGSYEAQTKADEFYNLLTTVIADKIREALNVAKDTDPLTEMGFGYYYRYMPESLTRESAKRFASNMANANKNNKAIKLLQEAIEYIKTNDVEAIPDEKPRVFVYDNDEYICTNTSEEFPTTYITIVDDPYNIPLNVNSAIIACKRLNKIADIIIIGDGSIFNVLNPIIIALTAILAKFFNSKEAMRCIDKSKYIAKCISDTSSRLSNKLNDGTLSPSTKQDIQCILSTLDKTKYKTICNAEV